MVNQDSASRLSEEQLFFFEETILGEADLVYRFCYALTLDSAQAENGTKLALGEAVTRIKEFIELTDAQVRYKLLKFCFDDLTGSSSSPTKSPLNGFLQDMSREVRAAILARDVAGLSTKQVMDLLGVSEEDLRLKFVEARRKLREHFPVEGSKDG